MRDPIRQAERLMVIRLRYTINSHLEDRGITTPAAVSAAIGLSAAEAAGLLRRRQWRAGDLAALQAGAGGVWVAGVPPATNQLLREGPGARASVALGAKRGCPAP